MSTILNGAVSAQLNKCTNPQNTESKSESFISDYMIKNSPLGSVIHALITDDVDNPANLSCAVMVANTQAIDALRVIAQCALRDADNSLERGTHADGRAVANAIDLVTQILSLNVDAQERINEMLERRSANE